MPKWIRFGALLTLCLIVGAVLYHLFRGSSKSPTPAESNPPPTERTPPVTSCPPQPPPKPEEVTLRLAKDSQMKIVMEGQITDPVQKNEEREERHSKREEPAKTQTAPKREQEQVLRSPPVVIVNEATPTRQGGGPPPDLWEMTYAADAGPFAPRLSDTNMVFTRVGGPL